MRKLFAAAGTVATLAAFAPQADATTGPAMLGSRSPVGVASNIASEAGNTGANLGQHVMTAASGAAYTCTTVTFHATSPVATNTLRFRPTYSGCTFVVGGTNLGGVNLDVNCEWTLTSLRATFNDSTGSGTGGTLDIPCPTTLTIPGIGCTIHLAATGVEGISSQNVNAAGANTTSTSPWGSKTAANLTGMHYSTTTAAGGNCIIAATGSTFTYVGSWYSGNLWGML